MLSIKIYVTCHSAGGLRRERNKGNIDRLRSDQNFSLQDSGAIDHGNPARRAH